MGTSSPDRRLCELLGLGLVVADVPLLSRWTTCVHEASHAVAAIYACIEWEAITVDADESGAGGRIKYPDAPPSRRRILASLALTTLVTVAAAVGEELLLGGVDADGVRQDLRTVFARWGCMRPDEASADEPHVREVRAQVDAARGMLLRHESSVLAIARALQSSGSLTRAQCLELLEEAGHPVATLRPGTLQLTEARGPDDEEARVRVVRESMRLEERECEAKTARLEAAIEAVTAAPFHDDAHWNAATAEYLEALAAAEPTP
ncbi:MAG TPA: hypothetical protein VGG39_24960 [Polyangiaceae bacterium]|jgi:hypothetical protein